MNLLPGGTITFLFTDIEGSTPLWESQPEQMGAALQIHHRILHEAIAAQRGVVFNIVGDSFLAAFTTAGQALNAAITAQRKLAAVDWQAIGPLRVRMGIHTGEAYPDEQGQYPASHTLNRASRIMSAGYGGQILLSGDAALLCEPGLPPDVSLLDLGLHHLKGLARPEHIFQARAAGLRMDFPPLASQLAALSNLPQQFTPFIGRGDEIAEINRLLDEPACRILVLLGPGGIGKTRLAIQVAAGKLAGFSHGVCFVPLAGVVQAENLTSAIARALEINFHQAGGDHRQQLLAALESRQMLILLDNFEQLVGEESAQLLLEIIAEAPGVKLLVTTRIGLNLGIERQYPLGGMNAPAPGAPGEQIDPAVVENFSAIRLFIERARRIDPKFTLDSHNLKAIIQICHKVQGMPLGIELAAAWLDVLSPQEIAAEIERGAGFLDSELHELPLRQRGLQAVFDSTWELLSPHEQEAFKTLSIFRNGFTRQAAQAVAGAALRDLAALANKSLVGRDAAGRYQVHELLRQFGAEQLRTDPAEMEAACERLTEFYIRLLYEQGELIKTTEQSAALQTIQDDFENILLAWSWAVEHCQVERLERALVGLFLYCDVHFLHEELQNGLEAAIRRLESASSLDENERRALAKLLTFRRHAYRNASSSQAIEWQQRALELRSGLAQDSQMGIWFTYLVGISPYYSSFATRLEHPEAIQMLSENLAYLRQQADRWGCALTLRQLGFRHEIMGDIEAAGQAYNEAASLFRACGDQIQLAWCLDDLGGMAVGRNDYVLADTLISQAQEIFETLGEQTNVAGILMDRGRYQEAMGNYTQALEYFQQSLEVSTKLGLRLLIPHVLSAASYTALRLGDTRLARQMRQRSLEISVENQDDSGLIWGKWELGEIERVDGNLAAARRLYDESLRLFESTPHINVDTFYQRGLGDIALAQGDYAAAQRHFWQSLELAQRAYHTWSAAYAFTGLGRAAIGLSDWSAAQGFFREAIQKAQQSGARGLVMAALSGLAELYAAQGESIRALELATFVIEQPATWHEFRQRAENVAQQALARLPADPASQAQARARAIDIEALITDLDLQSG